MRRLTECRRVLTHALEVAPRSGPRPGLIGHRSSALIIVLALLANILLSWSNFRGPVAWNCDPLGVLQVLVALFLLLEGAAVVWPNQIERAALRLAPLLLGALAVIRLLAF